MKLPLRGIWKPLLWFIAFTVLTWAWIVVPAPTVKEGQRLMRLSKRKAVVLPPLPVDAARAPTRAPAAIVVPPRVYYVQWELEPMPPEFNPVAQFWIGGSVQTRTFSTWADQSTGFPLVWSPASLNMVVAMTNRVQITNQQPAVFRAGVGWRTNQ